MKLLAIDTATQTATVAVVEGDAVLAEHERAVTTHSEGLLALVEETLAALSLDVAAMDAVVCGLGPGSFTGLRIGLATAKGLCFAANKPLVGVCSLDGVARGAGAALGDDVPVAVVLDARRKEIFVRLYAGGGERALGDAAVMVPADLPEFIAAANLPRAPRLAGDGALAYRELWPELELAPEDCHEVHAGALGLAARERLEAGDVDDLATLSPMYLRAPDIRPPSRGLAAQGVSAKTAPAATSAPTGDGDGDGGEGASESGDRASESGDADEISEAERAALIERFRQTGLRLDRAGRWWHEGAIVEHGGLARALHRWLDQLDDGRFVLRLDDERYAYVDVDDTPYVVRSVTIGDDAVTLHLSDGSDEPLDPATLAAGADAALYARVKAGRFEARFSRGAHYHVAELVEQDDDGFAFVLGETRTRVGQRAAEGST